MKVDERHTRSLENFLANFPKAKAYCLSQDPLARKIVSVEALPWQQGLIEMGFVDSTFS